VLDQMRKPKFVIADTMDLWLNTARADLLKLLRRIDALVLNDSEARLLTGDDHLISAAQKIHRLGPEYVIIKKGEHGSFLSSPRGFFLAPAFPLRKLVDPTGAGDSFVGGLIGYLAGCRGSIQSNLRRAIIYGTAVASFCCEGFGLSRTTEINRREIDRRVKLIESLVRF
jgi:sugar/nucleoside kinase (ribokinase family)